MSETNGLGHLSVCLTCVVDPTLGADECSIPQQVLDQLMGVHQLRQTKAGFSREAPEVALLINEHVYGKIRACWVLPRKELVLGLSPSLITDLGVTAGQRVNVFLPESDEQYDACCQRLMNPTAGQNRANGALGDLLSNDAMMGLITLSAACVKKNDWDYLPTDEWLAEQMQVSLTPVGYSTPEYMYAHLVKRAFKWVRQGDPTWVQNGFDDLLRVTQKIVGLVKKWQWQKLGTLVGFFHSIETIEQLYLLGEIQLEQPLFLKWGQHWLPCTIGRAMIMRIIAGFANESRRGLQAEHPGSNASIAEFGELLTILGEVLQPLSRRVIVRIVSLSQEYYGLSGAYELVRRLELSGLDSVTQAGVSIKALHPPIPSSRQALLSEQQTWMNTLAEQYDEGLITDAERYNKQIDSLSFTSERMMSDMRDGMVATRHDSQWNDCWSAVVFRGVSGRIYDLRNVFAMVGLVSGGSGEILERPILENWVSGLSPHSYFLYARSTRRAELFRRSIDREVECIRRVLVEGIGAVAIVEHDCGTIRSLPYEEISDGGDIMIAALCDRIAGKEIVEDGHKTSLRVHSRVRSAVCCESVGGVCQRCFGKLHGLGTWPEIGTRVGLWASEVLATASRDLVERIYNLGTPDYWRRGQILATHSGYVALVSSLQAPVISRREPACFDWWQPAPLPDGIEDNLVLADDLEVWVMSDPGEEIERIKIPHGVTLYVKQGQKVESGQIVAQGSSWQEIYAVSVGKVIYRDLVEGVSFRRLDNSHQAGNHTEGEPQHNIWVDGSADDGLEPRIEVWTGEYRRRTYLLPRGSQVVVGDSQEVVMGQLLAKVPYSKLPVIDLPAGRKELLRLLDAPRVENAEVLSAIHGVVIEEKSLELDEPKNVGPSNYQGSPRIVLVAPRSKDGQVAHELAYAHVVFRRMCQRSIGDVVHVGDPLCEGNYDVHQRLRIFGPETVTTQLLDNLTIQFAMVGRKIPASYYELVIRALLDFVRITNAGESSWEEGELVSKEQFFEANQALFDEGKAPAWGEAAIVGLARGAVLKNRNNQL